MKKNYLMIIVFTAFCGLSTFAQDYIYLKNGDKIEAIVSETTKTATLYTSYGSSSNELLIVDNKKIKLIAFANGKVKDFTDGSNVRDNDAVKYNVFSYHLADLLINNLTISYERILQGGKIGIQLPLSIGYSGDYQELGDFQNKFYSGLYVNFYPTGQGQWRYFTGPGIRVGSGVYEDGNNCYNCIDYGKEDVFYFKFHVNNGVVFSPIPELSLAATLSLGIRYVDSKHTDEKVRTTGAFSFNMSYRF